MRFLISHWLGKQVVLFPNHTTYRAKVGIFSWYFVKNYSFNFLKDLIWDYHTSNIKPKEVSEEDKHSNRICLIISP